MPRLLEGAAGSCRIQPEREVFCPVDLLILIELFGSWNKSCRIFPFPISYEGVLNNKNFQGQICPGLDYSSRLRVGSKKSVQQGRSRFCARSVHLVREHGKMARTPLAAFFNRPYDGGVDRCLGETGKLMWTLGLR